MTAGHFKKERGERKASSKNGALGKTGVIITLSPWKKVLFTGITTILIFGVMETVLFFLGIQPVLYEEDPYVGFSTHIPLFVEETGRDSQAYLVTANNKRTFFQKQRFKKEKPSGTYRIFAMGGSTTYGRPYKDSTSFCGWLREMLPAADPSLNWEMINAGGISYASYRVAILMEELVQYQPDLFIIYTGQNEFLEQRTYARVIALPSPLRSLGAWAGHSRIYTALKHIVEEFTTEDRKKEETDRETLPGEVVTILENSIGPSAYHRDDNLRERILEHFRFNLRRMIDIAESAHADILFVVPASNLKDASPFKSEHRDGLTPEDLNDWREFYVRAKNEFKRELWEESLKQTEEAIKIDNRYASIHYLRGRLLWKLNRFEEARLAFLRAKDEDVCPLRAPGRFEAMVAEVATERGVSLIDFMSLLEAKSAHQTPGNNFFLDHVHPTIEGNRVLATALLEEMVKKGFVHSRADWGPSTMESVKKRLLNRLDPTDHGIALKNLSRIFRWAGKYEEGYRLSVRSIKLIPDDAEALFLAGANALEIGLLAEAVDYIEKALNIDTTIEIAHFKLADAYLKLDKIEEAVTHYKLTIAKNPDFVAAYNNLGNALSRKEDIEGAARSYKQAILIDPTYDEAFNNLGLMLAIEGKYDEAMDQFRKALEINPDFADAANNLGALLNERGETKEAIFFYKKSVSLNPEHFEAQLNLGIIFSAQGRRKEAIEHYKKAVVINPYDTQAHFNFGRELAEENKYAEAVRQYRQALAIDPGLAEVQYHLGLALERVGNPQ